MPTIPVSKNSLYASLGRSYTRQQFDELCFDFGLELDEDTTDDPKRPLDPKTNQPEPPQLKIEVPANRYDMLCLEGIALNLNVFLGRWRMPALKCVGEPQVEVRVDRETERVRPYFSCAVLRGVRFTRERYESFIALQDRLHQNLARQRTLVSIGTHDLDTIEAPFSYEALPPEEIVFAPLNQEKEMNANEMMSMYEKDKHLSRYLPIIRDSPVYPIIYDKQRRVLSMPPIINSNHSKITLDTRNIFIDITATDKTKLEIVNQILVAMFSQYCEEPFTIEPVKVVSEHNGQSRITPDLTPRRTTARRSYLNSVCGLDLAREDLCRLLGRMGHTASPSSTNADLLDVEIPVTRADVLHEADIMEDVAIAYGFNNLPRNFPSTSHSTAAPLPLNKLTDIIRLEAAMAGWTEVMPLILCSYDECYTYLNKTSHSAKAAGEGECVRLQNPKTSEYQIVRTSLVPGLLKTIRENRGHGVPMKVFECADVVFKHMESERRSRNERRFAAAWYGKTSGFEQVHGLLDRVLLMLKSTFVTREDGLSNEGVKEGSYWIEEVDDPTFLAGHAAAIYLSTSGGKAARIGTFGILHPKVLQKFELPFPTSTLEINVEVFL